LGCGVIYHAARKDAEPSDAADAVGPTPLPECFRDFLIASNALFPSLAGELKEFTGIDIEFAPGAGLLFLVFNEWQRCFAEGVRQSLPAGLHLEFFSQEEVHRLEPHLTCDLLGAALLVGEHQVNPMLLAEAFKRAAVKHGCIFRPDTQATTLRRTGDRVVGVGVGDKFFSCGTVVNAAGSWAGRLAATAGLHLPIEPVRGLVVLTETLPPVLNACLSSATCYLAQKAHGEVLIGSTTEHAGFDVSVTPEAIGALCRGAVKAVPLLRRVRIKRTWAGLRPGTPDELPILGPVMGVTGYLNAAGGFRTGIVASPLTGRVVAQLTCGEALSGAIEPFLHDRFGLAVTQENLRRGEH
jgi:hydrogen cyanide synthase HcnC